jgi:hypothetical protein
MLLGILVVSLAVLHLALQKECSSLGYNPVWFSALATTLFGPALSLAKGICSSLGLVATTLFGPAGCQVKQWNLSYCIRHHKHMRKPLAPEA